MSAWMRVSCLAIILSSASVSAATFDKEQCLQKEDAKYCEKAIEILTPQVSDELIEVAALWMAVDALMGAQSDDLSVLEYQYKKDKKLLSPEMLDMLAALGVTPKGELKKKELYLTRLLIHIFKERGWQDHDYCLDLGIMMMQKNKSEALKIATISDMARRNTQPSFKVFEVAGKLIKSDLPAEAESADFKYNIQNTGMCDPSSLAIMQSR